MTYRVGDRFHCTKNGGIPVTTNVEHWVQITEIEANKEVIIMRTSEGIVRWWGSKLQDYPYLGNFAKSNNTRNLYEKLTSL